MALADGQDGVELLQVTLRALLPRTRRIAKAVAGDWVTDEDWEEGGQAAMLSMVRQFREAPPGELTFWEANFWEATKRACITEVRKFLRKGDEGVTSIDGIADQGQDLEAAPVDPLDQVTRREILGILTRDEAVAVELAWFQGIRVSAGGGTVSGLMGKSRRTIHNLLRSAKTKIIADPRCEAWLGRRSA